MLEVSQLSISNFSQVKKSAPPPPEIIFLILNFYTSF